MGLPPPLLRLLLRRLNERDTPLRRLARLNLAMFFTLRLYLHECSALILSHADERRGRYRTTRRGVVPSFCFRLCDHSAACV